MSKGPEPVVIKDFQKGIADSPHLGFADMRNIDVYSEPGVARVNYTLREWTLNSSAQDADASVTFTANAGSDTITTASGNPFLHDWNGTSFAIPVTVSNSGGALPAGLSANTVYYIFGQTDNVTHKLASTYTNANAGTPVDITDAGTGTHTITAVKPGQIKHIVTDYGTGYHYALDTNGRVWKTQGNNWYVISGNTLSAQSANGLAIWKGYLIVFRNTAVDLITLSTTDTNATWNNSWKSDLTSGIHHAIHGQDDILYICNDRYVASLQETSGDTFDPTDSASYTWTVQALDLPAGYKSRRLVELGEMLMIGANRDNIAESKIFPWDRVSDSFDLPVTIPEAPLHSMQVMGNNIYVGAGLLGSIWITNSVQVSLATKIPAHLFGGRHGDSGIHAMCVHQERLFFGVNSTITSGVYSFNPQTRSLVLEYLISTGDYFAGAGSPLQINAMVSVNSDVLLVAWYDSQTPEAGIDSTYVSNSNRYTSYAAYLISDLRHVATPALRRTFSRASIQLAEPLTTGQGIRLSYRKDGSSSFTTLGTIDYATYGAITGQEIDAPITDAEVVQIKAELTTVGTNGTAATPKLLNIQLR